MKKIYVLDTNVPLHDPNFFYHFGDNEIVLPAIVLEEVDNKKREMNEVGKNARMMTNKIKELRIGHEGKLSTGVPLENGATLRVELNHVSFKKLSAVFRDDSNDNRILAVAKNLHDEEMEKPEDVRREVILVSNDGIVLVKGDTLGLAVEMYNNDRVSSPDNVHKGYHTLYVDKETIDRFCAADELLYEEVADFFESNEHFNPKGVFVQDFILLRNPENSSQSALSRLLLVNGKKTLTSLVVESDDFKEGIYGIKPRNVEQKMALELLMDPFVPLVCLSGQAGTGKTLFALAAGLEQSVEDNRYKKISVARSVIPMGKDLGYLPGDMNEKLRPWIQPIYDNLEYLLGIDHNDNDGYGKGKKRNVEEEAQQLNIQVEALTYIRGRSIPEQFIIIDEAQNLSPYEVKTILTRVGEDTKIVLLGDPDQIDHPYLDSTNNGLTYVIERFKQEPDAGIVQLTKTERSSLADKAAKLL